VPDTEPGERDQPAGPCTSSSQRGPAVAVHRPAASRQYRPASQQLLRPEKACGERIKDTTEWLQSVVRGISNTMPYPRNEERLKAFRHEVLRMWWWPLRRRIQSTRWTWNKFWETFGNLLPEVEILHPYPAGRFAWQHVQVRTVCVRSASTDLCGGCRVTGIPTATQNQIRSEASPQSGVMRDVYWREAERRKWKI